MATKTQTTTSPITRRPIFDRDGNDTGATFGVEPRSGALTIRFDSRGTTEGTRAYRAGLVVLLGRLANLGAVVTDVCVDSLTVKGLSRADRRLRLTGMSYPLAFTQADAEGIRKAFHTAAAKVGRPKDAKGGGNGTKKLRLYVEIGLPAATLEDALAGKAK